jgi:hypothetical protein
MHVYVSGATVDVVVEPSDTGLALKQKVYDSHDSPPDHAAVGSQALRGVRGSNILTVPRTH